MSALHPMQVSRRTLVALVALGLWFGLDFVGVPGLVDREPLLSLAGLMLGVLVVLLVVGVRELRFVAAIDALALLVWLALQIETHWSTYLFPASPRKLLWYGRAFGDHLRILPALPDRTTPDAYHTVLAALLLANLASAIHDLFRRAPASG